jgi:hypothetical protein
VVELAALTGWSRSTSWLWWSKLAAVVGLALVGLEA